MEIMSLDALPQSPIKAADLSVSIGGAEPWAAAAAADAGLPSARAGQEQHGGAPADPHPSTRPAAAAADADADALDDSAAAAAPLPRHRSACARGVRVPPAALHAPEPRASHRDGLRRGGGARRTAEERWIGRVVHGPPAMLHATDLAGSGPVGVARAKAAAIVATALARACAWGGDTGPWQSAAHQQQRSLMVAQSIKSGVCMSLATPLERKAYSESLGSNLALRPGAPARATP